MRVCPSCGHHFRLSAEARLAHLLDHGTFVEHDAGLTSVDPLGFVDQKAYPDRIASAQLATGMKDAAVWGTGSIEGRPVAICVMDFGFMGGSMGAVVGEKVTRAAEYALEQRVPLIVVSASGGARMQEGTLALMQLAKTVAAIERLRAAGVPFISVLSDPTTGGVFASFAALGDVNVAEPNALIGFAGARVTSGTIAQELPPGFQRSEFLFAHGFLDRVVHRSELRAELAGLLGYLVPLRPEPGDAPATARRSGLPSFRPFSFLSNLAERVMPSEPWPPTPTNGTGDGRDGTAKPPTTADAPPPAASAGRGRARGAPTEPAPEPVEEPVDGGAPWLTGSSAAAAASGRTPIASRPPDGSARPARRRLGPRPAGPQPPPAADARARLAPRRGLHRDPRRPPVRRRRGDRHRASPGSTAAASWSIGQQKGADTDENIRRNFGMPHPEGYRKAMRAMELAERFGMPVVTFVDVPGRPSRRGVRGARHRRGDRPLDRADEPPPDADRHGHHRRGRLRRRAGDRRRRRRDRPRERRLLGDQPGGLRLDPVADRGRGRRPRRSRCA